MHNASKEEMTDVMKELSYHPKETVSVVLVTAGSSDFQGVYVDGHLVHQDNNISADELINVLGGKCVFTSEEIAEKLLTNYFPEDLEAIGK